MVIDLASQPAPTGTVRAQVCVIGAGIAGLTVAQRLAADGLDVLLLEAGGADVEPRSQQLISDARLNGHPHLGTTNSRVRAYGGTSLRWGGQLLPPPPDAAWPISPATLAPYLRQAEQLLCVDDLPYDAAAFFDAAREDLPPLLDELPELTASLSKWTPFGRRNLAHTFGRELLAHPRARVYLHAPVVELLLAASRSRVMAVLVQLPSGQLVRFEADHVVLAVGTVETSRLLLASRSVVAAGVGNDYDQVGRNFHDHLTLPVATITGPARQRILRELRPWLRGNSLSGATLHSAKLSPSPQLAQQLQLTPIMAHLTLEEFEGSGLATVRTLLTALQHGNLRSVGSSNLAQLPVAAVEGLRLAASALVHRRRYVSPSTTLKLYLNTAQDTPTASRITLASTNDALGLPLPEVDWHITAHELDSLAAFARYLRDHLPFKSIQWLPGVFNPDAPVKGIMLSRIHDAAHAMGGACMGTDPSCSVTDPDLTVHGIDNLSIASPAVFPTGTPPLPTLPLMALSLRVADHVRQRLAALRLSPSPADEPPAPAPADATSPAATA